MLPDNSARDVDWTRTHIATWQDMEKLLSTGKVKSIGVCNYSTRYLSELLPHTKVTPAVNQIENHPLLPQSDVVTYCAEKGILIEAYSPFGSTGSPLMQDPSIQKIASDRGVSAGTILLSWHINQGRIPLAKSVTPERITQNLQTVDLSERELEVLGKIPESSGAGGGGGGVKRYVYPAHGVDFGFPDKKGVGLDAKEEAAKRGVVY